LVYAVAKLERSGGVHQSTVAALFITLQCAIEKFWFLRVHLHPHGEASFASGFM
jgi:hypothetical protein